MMLFLRRLLSWVLGSRMQPKLQGLSVLSASVAFQSLRWLSNRASGLCFPCLIRCCLSLQDPAGPPPEVTLIPLLLLLVPVGCVVWSKMEMLQGVRLWLCAAGWEGSSASVTLASYLPSHLNWCLVWRPWWLGFLPSDYWGSLENQSVGRWW